MTSTLRIVIIGPMSGPIHLTVELEADQTSIRGLVRDRHARTVPFTGWLGLIGAINELQQPPVDDLTGRRTNHEPGNRAQFAAR